MTTLPIILWLCALPASAQFSEDAAVPATKPAPPAISMSNTGPTVVCDGKGGYRVELFGKEVLPHGRCLREHEESHIKDLEAACPAGCKGQADGVIAPYQTDPKLTPGMAQRCPKFAKFQDYWNWHIESECRGYSVQYDCTLPLYKKAKDPAAKGYFKSKALKDAQRGFSFWRGKAAEEKLKLQACED